MQSSTTNKATAESAQLPANAHLAAYAPSSATLVLDSANASPTYNKTLELMQHDVSATHLDVSIPALETSKKGKGVGKRLTDRQRVEILDLLEKSSGSLSNAEIARRYGITRAAIQKLKQKGAEVRARYRYGSADTRDGRKRGGHVLSVPFERELFEWVRGLKARKVPVPPSLVKEKAKLLVPKYGLGNFQASNGWYYNFCKRFNLSTGILVEEKPPTLAETATIDDDSTSLDPDQSQLQQMTINALEQQTYGQHFQQYQQQMAAMSAETLQPQQQQQQQSATQRSHSKSDRMIQLLEQQTAMIKRQTTMIEDQAAAIKKLIAVVTKADTIL
uniref:HTH CENPB-type domain-containing protein n=1 Tax=Peronospora matthiolae TaxID=2874970 RepID=A0AAV1TV37_9STRA